jgi:iron(III) transport system permease protein
MKLRAHSLPDMLVTVIIAAMLILFIGYPITAVLIKSFVVSGPMSKPRLAEITRDALAVLAPAERTALLERWATGATDNERVDGQAAALELAGQRVPWDRTAAFDQQAPAARAALAALPDDLRARVEADVPLAIAMLHKRVALAFRVRATIGEARFDTLRNGAERRFGFDHYLRLFEDPYLQRAARNSLTLATLAVVFTVTSALALAYAVNCGGVGQPALVRSVVLMPLVAPPVLIAAATVMLFGRRGLFTHGLLDQGLGLIDADETNIYGMLGVVFAQTLSFLPAAFIVLDNVLRRQNGRMDEAAAGLGADRPQIFGQVTLPLAWPGIQRAIVLVFIMSLTDFGNPLILGRDIPVIAGVVYDEITGFQNTALAAALCVWMIVPALALYLVLERLGGRRRYATVEAAGASELPLPRSWRFGLGTLAVIVTALVLTIYGTMVLGAFVRVWGVDWTPTLGYFTSTGVDVGLPGTGYGSSDRGLATVWDSLVIAGIAGPIGGLLAVVVAYVVERIRPPGADLIAFLSLVPAILPGIIFGVGYIIAFNVPFGFKSLSLTGGGAILVLNILFGHMYVGVLAARAALQRYDRGIEEAAESLGAGLVDRFRLVTLPMLGPAFLLGTLYVFVDGMTTLSAVIFLVSGDHKLASVAIFNHASSSEFGYAAAKSLVILVVALVTMTAVWAFERRRARRGDRVAKPSALIVATVCAP